MGIGPTLKGYLYVIVVEAKGLPDTGEGSDAIDTYCAVFLDGMEEGCTVPAFDTTTPVWKQKIKIKVIGGYDTMSLQMFDASKDDDNHLGIAKIDLNAVVDEQPHDLWIDLEKREESNSSNPVQGSVHCLIQYSAYRKGKKSKGPAAPAVESKSAAVNAPKEDEKEAAAAATAAAEAAKAERAAMKAQAEAAAKQAEAEAEAAARKEAEAEAAAAAKAAKEAAEKAAADAAAKEAAAKAEAAAAEAKKREDEIKRHAEEAAKAAAEQAAAAKASQEKAAKLRAESAKQAEAIRRAKMSAYIAQQKAAAAARVKKLESESAKKEAIQRAQRLAAEERWKKRQQRALELAKKKHDEQAARRQKKLDEQAKRRAARALRKKDMRAFKLFGFFGGRGRGKKQQQTMSFARSATPVVECPQSHPMELKKGGRGYERGWRCDGCSAVKSSRKKRYNCGECKYDLCKGCGRQAMKDPTADKKDELCPKGHMLVKKLKLTGPYARGFRCDKCSVVKRVGPRWNCAMCRYDVCMGCGSTSDGANDAESSDESSSSESFSESVDVEAGWTMQYEDSLMFM